MTWRSLLWRRGCDSNAQCLAAHHISNVAPYQLEYLSVSRLAYYSGFPEKNQALFSIFFDFLLPSLKPALFQAFETLFRPLKKAGAPRACLKIEGMMNFWSEVVRFQEKTASQPVEDF